MRKLLYLSPIIVAAFLISSCAQNDSSPSASRSFSDIVAGNAGNMVVYNAVGEQMREATVVIDGTFEELARGELVTEQIDEVSMTDQVAIAKVKVSQHLGSDAHIINGYVYMKVRMKPTDNFEDIQRVFPTGERVVAALARAAVQSNGNGFTVENSGAGLPKGARALAALPQGYFFQDPNGNFVAPLGGGPTSAEGEGISMKSLDDAYAQYTAAPLPSGQGA